MRFVLKVELVVWNITQNQLRRSVTSYSMPNLITVFIDERTSMDVQKIVEMESKDPRTRGERRANEGRTSIEGRLTDY